MKWFFCDSSWKHCWHWILCVGKLDAIFISVHKFFFKMLFAEVNIFHILWKVFSVEKFQPFFFSLQILRYLEGTLRCLTSFVGITFVYRTHIDYGFFSSYSEHNTIGNDFFVRHGCIVQCRWPICTAVSIMTTIFFSAKFIQCYLQYWKLQQVECITLNHNVWTWPVKWSWFASEGITNTFYTSQLSFFVQENAENTAIHLAGHG